MKLPTRKPNEATKWKEMARDGASPEAPPPPPTSPPQMMASPPLPPPPNSPPLPPLSARYGASPPSDGAFPPPPPFPPMPALPTLGRQTSDTSSTAGSRKRHTLQSVPRRPGDQAGDGTNSSFSSPLPPCPEDPPAPPPPSCTPPIYQPQDEPDEGTTEGGDEFDDDRVSSSTQQDVRSSVELDDDDTADADTEDMDADVQQEEFINEGDAEEKMRQLSSPPPPPPSPPASAVDGIAVAGLGTPPPPPSSPPFSPPSGGKHVTSATTDEDNSQSVRGSQESQSSQDASSVATRRADASNREIMALDYPRDPPAEQSRFYIGDIESYTIIDKVGSGTYGEVFKCQHKVSKDIVALKKLRSDVERNGFPVTSIREMKILKQLRHPNIVVLKELVSSSAPTKEGKRPPLYFAFEYVEHDLCGLLNHPRVKFSRTQIQCYMRQLLCGLAFMHRNKIVHRDIKASNLLLNNQGLLKITDFGLSRFWNDVAAKAGRYTNKVVTLWYRSPELLLGSTSYDCSVDVWSAGCIFAELFLGRPILQGKTEVDQLQLVFGLVGLPTEENWPDFKKLPGAKDIVLEDKYVCPLRERFKGFPPLAIDLLEKLLTLDPSKRITAAEAMDHDYFWRPLTCKPRDLPKFGVSSSHEYQSKKRHQEEVAAAAAAASSQGGDMNRNVRPRHYRGAEGHDRSTHQYADKNSHRGDRGRHHHRSNREGGHQYHDRDRDPDQSRQRERPRERSRSRERKEERSHHRSRHEEHRRK